MAFSNTKGIQLTQGKVALVDADDLEYLNQWYAVHNYWSGSNYCAIRMHRIVMNLNDKSKLVDHIDHNGLNNTKDNLRIATRFQNSSNRRSVKNSTSQYLGVSSAFNKWKSEIYKNKKKFYLGLFESEEDAALAYNNAAKIIHGEFANLNIISSGTY